MYDDAVEILKSKDNIVVAECICRKRKKVLGSGCDKRIEACFHVRVHGAVVYG
ncbi:MAG: hypothetical protein MZU91_00020 [Desulfosudis oleivorans]|nr:hypothetical protein [Desulfosudis oleivorans]